MIRARSHNKLGAMPHRSRGAVIIFVLWTAVLLTVLVTAMASKVQLSAKTAFHNQEGSASWAQVIAAINQAEMELMLEQMPRPIGEVREETDEGEIREPLNRFNGQSLELYYPSDEDIVVRIYDHAGKINLNRIPPRNMQLIIQKQLGPNYDDDVVADLMAAWQDWTDLNSLASLNGAEDEYYENLDPPYRPRNNPELDSVDELRLIRGFDELFADVNLDAAFTVYGSGRTINPNLATREAMRLIPGLDDAIIEEILLYRQQRDFSNRAEVGEVVPFENMAEASEFFAFDTSTTYSIFAYPRVELEETDSTIEEIEQGLINPDPVSQAYMRIVEVASFSRPAIVLHVDPYGRLPDTAPPRVEME